MHIATLRLSSFLDSEYAMRQTLISNSNAQGMGRNSFFNSLKFQKHTTKNPSDGEFMKDLNIFEEDVAAEEPKELEEIKEVLENLFDNDYKYVLFSFKLAWDKVPKLKIRFYLAHSHPNSLNYHVNSWHLKFFLGILLEEPSSVKS